MPGLTSSAHPNVSRHLVPRPLRPCQRALQQIFQRGHQHRAFVSPAESDAISYADRVWRSPWLSAESRTGPLVFFALDLLFLNGREHGRATADQAQGTAATPIQEGEQRLAIQRQRWASVQHQAGRLGLEGAISTQADRPYVPGDRGIRVMSKCLNRVECIVVCWTDPEGSPSHAGWSVALRAKPLLVALLVRRLADSPRVTISQPLAEPPQTHSKRLGPV